MTNVNGPTLTLRRSPLATIRTAYGRCGEESVLTVAALRAVGIPARQCYTPLWAHCDDNHAWVEAWDQQRNQWTIVEATVGQGLATMSIDEQAASTGGSTGSLFGQLMQALYEYGLFGVLGWLFRSYGFSAGLILMAIFLGTALLVKLSRRYAKKKSKSRPQSMVLKNPRLIGLHRMLARMDHKIKTAGFRRGLGETLHTFSGRLRKREAGDGLWTKISDWYLEYAHLRYRGGPSHHNYLLEW